jgi:type IV secretion system protein VirB11
VRERQNVLIAGATSSGKTTLANALLAEIAATGDRVLVLSATGIYRPPRSRHKPARARPAARSRSRHIPASA